MPRTRQQKIEILQNLLELLETHPHFGVFDFRGLEAGEMVELRKRAKAKKGLVKVVKKSILQRALKEKGIDMDVLGLEGQLSLILMGEDFISPLKEVYNFAKEIQKETPKLLAGFIEGRPLGKEEIEELATLPSVEELRAKLVGSLLSPVSSFLGVMTAPQKGLLVLLSSRK